MDFTIDDTVTKCYCCQMSNIEVISPSLEVRRLRGIVEEQRSIIEAMSKARTTGCERRVIVGRVKPIESFRDAFSKNERATISLLGTDDFSIVGKSYMVVAAPMSVSDGSTVMMCSMVMRHAPTVSDVAQFVSDVFHDTPHKSIVFTFGENTPSAARQIGSKKMHVLRFFVDLWPGALAPMVAL